MAAAEPKKVLITGAATPIARPLVAAIARGDMLGPGQRIILHLFDIPPLTETIKGVAKELKDQALPLLAGVVPTTDLKEAFSGVDYALLLGAMPHKEGMEIADRMRANAAIFKQQGKALNDYANKNVKVVVVGNPANTNALLALTSAPDLPKENFSALTRLDNNRARSLIALKAKVDVKQVRDVFVWGSNSSTQYPDVSNGYILDDKGGKTSVNDAVKDDAYLRGEFIRTVQQRDKLGTAASAAEAIVDHVHDWVFGTGDKGAVSMAIYSDGSYGVREGLIYSFPVTIKDGKPTIVQGYKIDDFSRQLLRGTEEELAGEKETALQFLA